MMKSATCAECRLLLGGYALHALEPDETAVVEGHIAACAECARELRSVSHIPALLDLAGGEDAETAELPPALEEAVLDRFAREHRPREGGLKRAFRKFRQRVRVVPRPLPAAAAGAIAAAAAALAVVLATSGGGAGGEVYNARLTGFQQAAGATASARLVTFSQGTRVNLRVSGLHGGPGAIYELWCLRDDGARVSAGTFRVDSSGRANVGLTTAAVPSEYHRLAVEREQVSAAGWSGVRVMAGAIEFH